MSKNQWLVIVLLVVGNCLILGVLIHVLASNLNTLGDSSTYDETQEEMKVSIEEFSISSSHNVIPEDVLQEVSLFIGGEDSPMCPRHVVRPSFLGVPINETELWYYIIVYTCGWQPNELVRITFKFPDGRVISQAKYPDSDDTGVSFVYATELTDPPGIYVLYFRGKNGSLEHSIRVDKASGPKLYILPPNGPKEKLLLYNFEPHEHVRLFAYDFYGTLAGWQEYQLNSSGQLIVQLNQTDASTSFFFAVVGDVSGEAVETIRFGGSSFLESILVDPK